MVDKFGCTSLIPCELCIFQIQALWLLRRVLVEHNGASEWRHTVGAQLLALIGRVWLETHALDPALKLNHNVLPPNADEEEVGKNLHRLLPGLLPLARYQDKSVLCFIIGY